MGNNWRCAESKPGRWVTVNHRLTGSWVLSRHANRKSKSNGQKLSSRSLRVIKYMYDYLLSPCRIGRVILYGSRKSINSTQHVTSTQELLLLSPLICRFNKNSSPRQHFTPTVWEVIKLRNNILAQITFHSNAALL